MQSKYILIYDSSCKFCRGLAKYLKSKFAIEIISNKSRGLPKYISKKDVQKNVHLIVGNNENKLFLIYTGAEAAVQIVGQKYPFVIKIYSLIIFHQIIDFLYFIIKKSRKYIT